MRFMGEYPISLTSFSEMFPESDLDERIRKLCAQAVKAEEPELSEIIVELRKALREHSTGVREITKATLKRIEWIVRERDSV